MSMGSQFVGAGDPEATVLFARLFAYLVIAGAATVLLGYLVGYVRYVLAEGFRYEWGYLAVGIGAAIVYGVAGIASQLIAEPWLDVFVEGAVLFFILFVALGIRAMYHVQRSGEESSPLLPVWADYLVIAVFIVAWWAGFLTGNAWTRPVVAVGWVGASIWAVMYGVQTVRVHEGTSLAALTRHLLPAILCVVVVVLTDLVGEFAGIDPAFVDAVWLVVTILVGAFLFNTAVAIRQQGGEVQRMYDWTTWRQQSVDER